MRTDLDRLSELEADGSGVIDTDDLANRISSLQHVNDDLGRWVSDNSDRNPDACGHARQVMQGNQDSMGRLRQQLEKALAYTADSSIYASSSSEMDVLDQATAAMEAVRYDPVAGTYDLSGADLSWATLDLIGKYADAAQRLGAGMLSSDLMRSVVMALMGEGGDCCAYGGDPVNLATGNFIYAYDYLAFDCRPRISLRLFYNSHNTHESPLGRGWIHSFAVSLSVGLNRAVVTREDGHGEIFLGTPEEGFTHLLGQADTLEREGEGYLYVSASGIGYRFDAEGRCLSILDRLGRGVVLDYDGDGLLACARSTRGPVIRFAYDERGRLVHASDDTGRHLAFSSQEGQVSGLETESGARTSFSYDSHGYLSSVTNARGITELRNAFDAEGRVVRQEFADGGVISYAYDDDRMRVAMTDQLGNESTYVHDGLFRTIEVRRGDAVERMDYSEKNLKTRVTNPRGLTSRYQFDEVGNLTCAENPLGERTTYEYNALNEPVRGAVDGTMVFRNEYDERGQILRTVDAVGNETRFSHNEEGDVTSITRADGSVATFEHNALGMMTTAVGPQGAVERYEYDERGLLAARVDANGNRMSFEHDALGNVTRMVNAEGNHRSYKYDACGLLLRMVDYDGTSVSYEYDAMGRPIRFVDKDGNESRREYDAMGQLIRDVDAAGAATTFQYDARGNVAKVTNALGISVGFEYDLNGNRTKMLLPDGTSTRATYDLLDRVRSVSDGLDNTTYYRYDAMGNLVLEVDPLGNQLQREYDAACRLTSCTDTLGRTTSYEYTALGDLSRVTDAASRVTSYDYLPDGLLRQIVNPDGTSLTFGYDAARNITSKTSQNGYELSYAYDAMNRITRIANSQGQSKSYGYDAMGNRVSKTDGKGNVTSYAYTPSGRLREVVEASGAVTRYQHDALGNLTRAERLGSDGTAHARTTSYERDVLGRVTCITDALGNRERAAYDAMGRMRAHTDADGYVTSFGFDGAGRMSAATFADGRTTHMAYDPLSRLVELRDWLGTTSFAYDAVGNMTRTRDHAGREMRYDWGRGDELRSVVYPGGMRTSYDYDEALRLSGVHARGLDVAYEYDANGNLAARTYSNGTGMRLGHDARGRLTHLSSYDAAGPLDEFSYAYDLCDNKSAVCAQRRGMPDLSGAYAYDYDELNHLVGVTRDGKALRSYEYDAFGNRTRLKDVRKGTTDYSYNALDQLVHATDAQGEHDYRYDGRGNLVADMVNGEPDATYEYDALNRLACARRADGRMARYAYDGMLRRRTTRRQLAEGAADTVEYVLDPTRPCNNLAQTIVDGHLSQSYLWGGGNLVAVDTDEGKAASVTQDPLGSVSRILDEKGDVLSSFGYDEFGNSAFESDVLNVPFSYTGYLKDGVTQGLYAQARQYLPNTGQFMSADPLRGYARRPATANRYSYCCQQPLDFVDLLGLSRQDAVDYAHQYATDDPNKRNPNYPSFGSNCANFVSQALYAGGMQMSKDWFMCTADEFHGPLSWLYSNGFGDFIGRVDNRLGVGNLFGFHYGVQQGTDDRGNRYTWSNPWGAARDQYEYFSDPKNGYTNGTIDIGSYNKNNTSDTERVESDIQEAAQTVQPGDLLYWDDGDGVHHATIVTKVKDGEIYYSGNTNAPAGGPSQDVSMKETMGDNGESVHIVKLKDECFD